MPSPSPVLRAAAVGKRYGKAWAVKAIDLELSSGETLLLTGHNGSGKSTLLSLFADLVRPTSGACEWFGGAEMTARRQRIGLVSHHSHLYEDLSARENLQFVARALGRSRDQVAAALTEVGLADRADRTVRTFSAGQKKRLAIARILLKRPSLILLDEPFGELDPAGSEWLEQLIARWRTEQAAVVLATHLIQQGEKLSTRRLHLDQGLAT